MKKMPLIIIVPLIAVLAVVVFGMLAKVSSPAPVVVIPVNKGTDFPNPVDNTTTQKPSTFLGSLFGQKAVTPTPTPLSSGELSTELKNTYDDGGQADLEALQSEASSL